MISLTSRIGLIATGAAFAVSVWMPFHLEHERRAASRAFLAEKIARQIPGEVRAIRCDDFPQAVPTINRRTEYFRCDRDGQEMTFRFFDSLDDAWNYTPIRLITRWDGRTHRETILFEGHDE